MRRGSPTGRGCRAVTCATDRRFPCWARTGRQAGRPALDVAYVHDEHSCVRACARTRALLCVRAVQQSAASGTLRVREGSGASWTTRPARDGRQSLWRWYLITDPRASEPVRVGTRASKAVRSPRFWQGKGLTLATSGRLRCSYTCIYLVLVHEPHEPSMRESCPVRNRECLSPISSSYNTTRTPPWHPSRRCSPPLPTPLSSSCGYCMLFVCLSVRHEVDEKKSGPPPTRPYMPPPKPDRDPHALPRLFPPR
ncbi:hypothetical protein GGR56DRAFT_273576 [Xylariaceae sp. FL0804]|nr:hypothetical protein GGR56DRAFT_273576 [Xylariaceae sp. FL0804]